MIKTKRSELCSWAVDHRQKNCQGHIGPCPPTRIEYGVEIRGCNLGAALGAIKLGKGEHLLRSGGTAGDSFVGFDGIFERYRVYSRQL